MYKDVLVEPNVQSADWGNMRVSEDFYHCVVQNRAYPANANFF